MIERVVDLSLPFDKYKDKEYMQRRTDQQMTQAFNERLAQIKKKSSNIIEEQEKPNGGFLDRLMKKNFELYYKHFDERQRFQSRQGRLYMDYHTTHGRKRDDSEPESFELLHQKYEDIKNRNKYSTIEQQRLEMNKFQLEKSQRISALRESILKDRERMKQFEK